MVLPLEAVEKELVACYDTCRERPTAAAARVSKPSAVRSARAWIPALATPDSDSHFIGIFGRGCRVPARKRQA
jgi:hypothetical protein